MAHAIVLEAGVDRSAARAISGVPVATLAGVVARTAHEAVGVQVAVVGALALACLAGVNRCTITALAQTTKAAEAFAGVLASLGERTVGIVITEVGAIFAPVDGQATALEAVANVTTLAGAISPALSNLNAHAIFVAWVRDSANGGTLTNQASAAVSGVAGALALVGAVVVALCIRRAAAITGLAGVDCPAL